MSLQGWLINKSLWDVTQYKKLTTKVILFLPGPEIPKFSFFSGSETKKAKRNWNGKQRKHLKKDIKGKKKKKHINL